MIQTLLQEVAELREKNEILEAELAAHKLRMSNENIVPLMNRFKLTNQEASCLLKLSDGRPANKYWLAEHISKKDDVEYNLAAVIVHKIRKKIRPLEIKLLWGTGYQLQGDSLAAIREVIA